MRRRLRGWGQNHRPSHRLQWLSFLHVNSRDCGAEGLILKTPYRMASMVLPVRARAPLQRPGTGWGKALTMTFWEPGLNARYRSRNSGMLDEGASGSGSWGTRTLWQRSPCSGCGASGHESLNVDVSGLALISCSLVAIVNPAYPSREARGASPSGNRSSCSCSRTGLRSDSGRRWGTAPCSLHGKESSTAPRAGWSDGHPR